MKMHLTSSVDFRDTHSESDNHNRKGMIKCLIISHFNTWHRDSQRKVICRLWHEHKCFPECKCHQSPQSMCILFFIFFFLVAVTLGRVGREIRSQFVIRDTQRLSWGVFWTGLSICVVDSRFEHVVKIMNSWLEKLGRWIGGVVDLPKYLRVQDRTDLFVRNVYITRL